MSSVEICVIDNALLQKSLNGLQSEDKRKRKSSLDELRKLLFCSINRKPSFFDDHEDVLKAIIWCFGDQSEACRESAVTLFRDLLLEDVGLHVNLTLLVPTLSRRLGAIEMIEPSEEVRCSLVELLHAVLKRVQKGILPFFNDIVQILVKAIVDPYPKIKRESCECVSALALAIPENFHMQSESLVKPLIQILTHQQYRVRFSAILALGIVVRYGNSKSIKDVSGPLAERLFDQTPQVREAVTQIVGDWLINMPDRYSYFHIMIPLILTSLNDQSPDIQEKAWELWNQAGEQWKNENEDDIKDKIDFLHCAPTHYPTNCERKSALGSGRVINVQVKRPNIGCRTLIKRNLHKIAPALVRELEDWLVDVRIKASQLLCVIILNAEADLHQYLEQLLLGMYRACNDEDPRVVNNIERAAHLIGYFIPPASFWTLMHPIMDASCQQGHICVLASIMSGSERNKLQTFLTTIFGFLEQPSICQCREVRYQLQLIKCCQSAIDVCGAECILVSQQLFNILVTVMALTSSDEVSTLAEATLENLKNLENVGEVHELYEKYMRPLLQNTSSAPELWTVHCPERLIFQALIIRSGPALSNCLDIMVPTLSASLQPENQDGEMKLKLMTTIAKILQNADKNHCLPIAVMDPFLLSLVKGVIVPNLVWKAGRTAEALRTITVSCFLSILQTHGINRDETLIYLLDSLVPLLLTLIEDASRKTRLYSCHAICHIVTAAQKMCKLNAEHIHNINKVAMKRLDDVDDGVRKSSVDLILKLFTSLPEDYNTECSSAHIEALYSVLLIHLDDPNAEFGNLVLGVLKQLSILKPEYLQQRLKSTEANFRNQIACQDLLSHVSPLTN